MRKRRYKPFFFHQEALDVHYDRPKKVPPWVAIWNPNAFYSVAKKWVWEPLISSQNKIWTIHPAWTQDMAKTNRQGFEEAVKALARTLALCVYELLTSFLFLVMQCPHRALKLLYSLVYSLQYKLLGEHYGGLCTWVFAMWGANWWKQWSSRRSSNLGVDAQ
jgi:hypothetical protein